MKIEQSPWSLAKGEMNDGKPFLLRFRDYFPTDEEQAKYCYLIEITWKYEDFGSGMPDEETLNKMQDFEVIVDDGDDLQEISILMASVTGNNKKIWHFYTISFDLFMEKLNQVMDGYEVLPLKIEVFLDEEWNAYKEFVGGVEE